jgi:cytochrome c oxidase subunit 2
VRRGSLVQLIAIGVVVGAGAAAVAVLVPWLPKPAGKEAHRIDFVFWFVTAICLGIFTLVFSVSIYSLIKFRVRADDDSDGPPIHGHTGLEVAWTATPAALVTAISIVSAVVLAQNGHVPKNHVSVKVTAQQFAWSFEYPQYGNLKSGVLRVPLDKSVDLAITSIDVTHSFWVPEFGQKLDAVPGSTNHLLITPDRLGTFPVICTELCGLGHAVMRSEAIVMKPGAFRAWAKGGKPRAAAGGPGAAAFAANGCTSCHTLAAAGASGTIGPDLDNLPAEARKAGKPLEQFIRQSILSPNAYIEPGFPKNTMPTDFGSKLSKAQLDALVQYLIRSSMKGKKS